MQLLVSVRDLTEARAAWAGGADLIDLKEPANGPLGMVSHAVFSEVICELGHPLSVQLSAALGEVGDWDGTEVHDLSGVNYCKLGLSRLSVAGGFSAWRRVRERIDRSAANPIRWIAVCYADFEAAAAPLPEDVLQEAIDSGCAGILFDTWNKSSGKLWEHLSPRVISVYLSQAHAAGLMTALAGKLGREDVRLARELGADVFAVRSAACSGGNRSGSICGQAVAELRQLINA